MQVCWQLIAAWLVPCGCLAGLPFRGRACREVTCREAASSCMLQAAGSCMLLPRGCPAGFLQGLFEWHGVGAGRAEPAPALPLTVPSRPYARLRCLMITNQQDTLLLMLRPSGPDTSTLDPKTPLPANADYCRALTAPSCLWSIPWLRSTPSQLV